MNSSRVNLDAKKQHFIFLFLSLFFVLLSLGGLYMIFDLTRPVSQTPADSYSEPDYPEPQSTDIITPSPADDSESPSLTPTLTESPTTKPSPSPKATSTPKPSPSPTPSAYTYTSDSDKFQITYPSSRTLYTDQETTGNRYTFYRSDSSFAIHAGSDWSWIHPGREFSDKLIVGGQNTFRYDITTQTIVDLEKNGLKYTIQCIHNGQSVFKSECDKFLADFKVL